MRALTAQQQRFVLALMMQARKNPTRAARAAGYSDVKEGAKVRAFHLVRNEKVVAALQEEARRRLDGASFLAAGVLVDILTDPKETTKERRAAAGMVLDRTGLGASQTINVNKTVTRKVDVSAAADKIAEFRRKFPDQFAKLIGGDAASPAVIDGEFTEVKA